MYKILHKSIYFAVILVCLINGGAKGLDPKFQKVKEIIQRKDFTKSDNKTHENLLSSWIGFDERNMICILKGEGDNYAFYKINSQGKEIEKNVYEGKYFNLDGVLRYPSRTPLYLKDGRWFFIGGHSISVDSYGMDVIQFDEKGKLIRIDTTKFDTQGGVSVGPQMLKDSKGGIYLVGGAQNMNSYLGLYKIDLMAHKFISNILSDYSSRFSEIGMSFDFSAVVTIDDNIFVCSRPVDGKGNIIDAGIMIMVFDFMGNIISSPQNYNIKSNAYRKIKDVTLPGNYSVFYPKGSCPETISYGHDLSVLSNGEIILAVMAKDEDNVVCVYLLKFDKSGKLVKPGKTPIGKAISMDGKEFPQNVKAGIYVKNYTDINSRDNSKQKRYQVFWGYDDSGNFYWSSFKIEGFRDNWSW